MLLEASKTISMARFESESVGSPSRNATTSSSAHPVGRTVRLTTSRVVRPSTLVAVATMRFSPSFSGMRPRNLPFSRVAGTGGAIADPQHHVAHPRLGWEAANSGAVSQR